MAEKHLTLYGRAGCHLCHDMGDELSLVQGELNFSLEIIDIDNNPGLVAQYGELVPVLVHGDKEICHYFLDLERLRAELG